MELGTVASWAAFALAFVLAVERAWSFIGRAKYATREEVLAAIDLVKDAHHRIDIVEVGIKGLPGYDKFNEMDGRVGQLLAGQAARREWENGVKGELERIYGSLERLEIKFDGRKST